MADKESQANIPFQQQDWSMDQGGSTMRTEKEIKEKLGMLLEKEGNYLREGIPWPEYPHGYKSALEWVLG